MSLDSVCCICLATEVKMYARNSVLDVCIETLFGDIVSKVLLAASMPKVVCYECTALMKKFHKFREKFTAAQRLLCELLEGNHQITKEDIQKIDRKALQLESNLVIEFNPLIDSIDIKSTSKLYTDSLEEKNNKLEVDVKDEDKTDSILQNLLQQSSREYEETSIDGKIHDIRDHSDCDDDDVPLKNLRDGGLLNIKKEPNIELDNVFVSEPVVLEKKKSGKKSKNIKNAKKAPKTKSKKASTANKYEEDLSLVSGFIRDPSKMAELAQDFEIIKLTTFEEQMAELEKRKETLNYKMSPFKCEHCYRGFLHEDTLKNHLVYHEKKMGYTECALCHMQVRPRSKFHQHMLRHTTRFHCRHCEFVCSGSNQAVRHAEWHKGVEYKCDFCTATFAKLTSQQTHIRTQHRTAHVCASCGYSFVSERGLKMHQAKAHRDTYTYRKKAAAGVGAAVAAHEKQSGLYCGACDLLLADQAAWARHMATSANHRTTQGWSCRHCGLQFSSAAGRARHGCRHARRRPPDYRRRRRPTVAYPRDCEICSLPLQSRQAHYRHYQQAHTGAVYPHATHNYICEHCGKGFGILQVLKQHRLKHQSLRTFSCDVCPKAFYNNTQLQLHLKSHSANRPYPCQLCGKCFKTNIALYAHTKRHEGVRKFPCQYCGKAFTTAPNMRLHIKHVHMHLADKHAPTTHN